MLMRLLAMPLLVASVLSVVIDPAQALAAPAAQATPDPGAPGPLAITRTGYDGGDESFLPSGWTRAIEVRARVTHPTNLGSGGPFPLVILLHGRHAVCHDNVQPYSDIWPCPPGSQPIPSYLGYEYFAGILASHGYIVVSISANGINALDENGGQTTDGGMQARAELVNLHMDLWNIWNTTTTGTFGSLFTGRVNMSSVGLMGHSRGGEGVVRAHQLNAGRANPYGIRAVFPLAPVDFHRFVVNNVALAVLLPYCDGDVSDLQGVHFYDDARYNVAGDTAGKYTILVMGANHNYYNTVWTPGAIPGGFDDWLSKETQVNPSADDPHCNPNVSGNGRLSAAQQRGTGLAYMAAFFRVYLRQVNQFAPILHGDAPPPASAQTSAIHVSYHAPGTSTGRRDINRLLSASNLSTNTVGGAVTTANLAQHAVCGGQAPQPIHCLSSTTNTSFDREPHTGLSRFSNLRGLSQLNIQWAPPGGQTASWRNAIPAASDDVSGFARLQFRASTVWGNSANPAGAAQNLRVIFTDSANRTAAARVSDHSNGLFYPPGSFGQVTPKALHTMVRIPLSAFVGVDLHDIRSVELRFDQTATGWLLISDLAFANPVPAIASIGGTAPAGDVVGSAVTIAGTNLVGVTAVRFNGTPASFAVDSTYQVRATVPAGATTGPISVVTALGTVTSPASFNVYVATGNVGVQVTRESPNPPTGGPALRATFSARPTCGPISQIQFGNPGAAIGNSRVAVLSPAGGPANQTTGFTYTPPAGTTSVTIRIQRANQVQTSAATVSPIVVTDGCGDWRTLAGGGATAFN